MRLLGLGTQGDAGAAVVEDGRLIAAVNEERLSRIKLAEGFPRASIREVFRLSGAEAGELDAVLVGSREGRFVDGLRPQVGWHNIRDRGQSLTGLVKGVAGRVSRFGRALPFLEDGYYALLQPAFLRRRRLTRQILRREFGVRCPIVFVDHHLCHVTSAYFTSGFADALVVSLDGGGDRRSGLIYAAKEGRFEPLHEISAFNSLGNFYAYATQLCGFVPNRHEGKITGLAAYGEPVYQKLLNEFVTFDAERGTIVNDSGLVFGGATRELAQRLPVGWKREDLAASIQGHFEDVVARLITYWTERTGLRSVALAGGVFANVLVNQTVHELREVDRVFVHPGMGDGGLGVGAALGAYVPGILDEPVKWGPRPLEHAFLGPAIDEPAVDAALRAAGLAPEARSRDLEEEVADLLGRGYTVARATGRLEYGSRALGNRSILYQPADPSVNDWLNDHLGRTEFMPFAPAVLWEERERCFDRVSGAEHAAEFMTITLDCTTWMRERMPGVVHIDGTARPQLVREEVNPGLHAILRRFRNRSGLPGVVNTSFNMHEEPIACTAEDCLRAFLAGRLDYLALGPHLIKHPAGVRRSPSAVTGGDASLSLSSQ